MIMQESLRIVLSEDPSSQLPEQCRSCPLRNSENPAFKDSHKNNFQVCAAGRALAMVELANKLPEAKSIKVLSVGQALTDYMLRCTEGAKLKPSIKSPGLNTFPIPGSLYITNTRKPSKDS